MARDFNQFRNANAKLISKNINTFGKRWAAQDGADGYSVIDVVVTDTTQDVKLYLEGSNDITVFPVASDVSKLCKQALTSFPNITTLYLFSPTLVDIAEETENQGDYLDYLNSLTKIYVPSALLDRYKSTYSNLSTKFDIIIEDLTITIGWENDNTLTSEEVTRQLNMLESAYLNQATKLVIDDRYTDYLDTLWAYNFTEKCSALNNNIWHGTTKVSFASYTIADNTQDHILTASVVEEMLGTNYLSADKTTLIEKIIVPVDFTSYASGSFAKISDNTYLPNLRYLETCYQYGNIELDLQGDIVAKITSLGKTLGVELSNARSHDATSSAGLSDFSIIPPLNITTYQQIRWENRTNLVYLSKLKMSFSSYSRYFTITGNTNLIYMDIDISEIETFSPSFFGLNGNSSLKYMFAYGVKNSFNINSSTQFTRQSLVDLINSLGTPATQQTLTIGATNLAKLTQADIDIATAKNWVVQ